MQRSSICCTKAQYEFTGIRLQLLDDGFPGPTAQSSISSQKTANVIEERYPKVASIRTCIDESTTEAVKRRGCLVSALPRRTVADKGLDLRNFYAATEALIHAENINSSK